MDSAILLRRQLEQTRKSQRVIADRLRDSTKALISAQETLNALAKENERLRNDVLLLSTKGASR